MTGPRGHSKEYALNQDELRRFESCARSPRDKALVRLLARWGLRAEEAAHFSAQWFSGQRGILTIPRICRCEVCLAAATAGKASWKAKNENANRAVPITKHTETWEAVKVFLVHAPTPEDSVVSRQAVWKSVKKIADRAGILHLVFPHALRSTAATQLAAMGLNEKQICQIMGWGDLRSARPYVRTSGGDAAAAFEGRDLSWW